MSITYMSITLPNDDVVTPSERSWLAKVSDVLGDLSGSAVVFWLAVGRRSRTSATVRGWLMRRGLPQFPLPPQPGRRP